MGDNKRYSQYSEKLKNPRWQKKRLEILERDKWCCQRCFDINSPLHVHHRVYITDKEPWQYHNDFLITLCENCHEDERDVMHEIITSIIFALKSRFLSNEIDNLSIGISQMPMLHTPEVVASVYSWAFSSPDIQRELIDRYFQYIQTQKKDKANVKVD